MPKDILDAHELGAMLEAGVIAGGYLDEIGKTDLANLRSRAMAGILAPVAHGIRARPAPQDHQ